MCLMCTRNIPRNSRLYVSVCVHRQEPANADVLKSIYNQIDLI